MLLNFVAPRNLGHVTGEQGMLRLFPGLVRIADVAFASWDRFPQRRWTGEPIPALVPDLAIEVLSISNTPAEMSIKVAEYFTAGVRLVWLVDLRSRTAVVYTAADNCVTLHEHETLDGAAVLPGFTLSLRELFAELDRHG
jgi:Uma2 family endonuclease